MINDTLKAFQENEIPVDPPLPEDFDNTLNELRPDWQDILWDRPFILTVPFSGNQKYRKKWFESWPTGKRFDVRCLDGGACDRSTVWGMFATIGEAVECCKKRRKQERNKEAEADEKELVGVVDDIFLYLLSFGDLGGHAYLKKKLENLLKTMKVEPK